MSITKILTVDFARIIHINVYNKKIYKKTGKNLLTITIKYGKLSKVC